MSNSRKHAHGFTLIELLVVMAIISLLISVLLPALALAREQGKTAKCLSNLRQIGAYHTMYLGQEDGPTWHVGGGYDNYNYMWLSSLIFGGFQAPVLDQRPTGFTDGDFYVIPTELRPLNATIVKPTQQKRDPVWLYTCPSDRSSPGQNVAAAPVQATEEDPYSSWEYYGTSFSLNWDWMEYYISNGAATTNDFYLDDTAPPYRTRMPGLGKKMLARKVGGPSARFAMFYEGLMGQSTFAGRPDGSGLPRVRGWHRKFSSYSISFLDGSAAFMYADTRYCSDPDGGRWTVWPEPKSVYPDLWYP